MKFRVLLVSLLICFAPASMAESLLWIKGNHSVIPDAVIKPSGELWLKGNSGTLPDAFVKNTQPVVQLQSQLSSQISEAKSDLIICRDNQIWLSGDMSQEPDAKLDKLGNVWLKGNDTDTPDANVSHDGFIWLINNYTNTADAAVRGGDNFKNAFIASVYLMI
ncbi:hypothetical protein [Shewanella woodyi]|uniref:Periplasmic protein n=1 Tax=Shewanella woodyi (strain ATCC 51908 / MS32) TaxID=392500 RepID=B1KDC4_SHEWM|nr:hypothetical protein [Shewanella woodyi]ACA84925.1 hypothetical protein Swoo_0629 [Shewanella woodyi ATCC 51908]